MKDLNIDPDIKCARSMPSRFYTDADLFDASKDLIFAKTWQYAGVRIPSHNVRPVRLLPGFLDEPLIITSDKGIRCFPNVCTHRAMALVDAPCTLRYFRCRYHGRKFTLDGKILSMPGFEEVSDFPGPEDDLSEIAAATLAGLDFVSLDPAAKFSDFFSPLTKVFNGLGKEVTEVREREYLVNAHWALYCENYLEGLHIPYVHKSLNREIDFESYRITTFRYSSLQTASSSSSMSQSEGNGHEGSPNDTAASYFFVFPNLMFNFYSWGCSVNVVEPITFDSTRVRYISLIADGSSMNSGPGSDLDRVEREDQAVVEAMQKGVRSRFYDRGRYSVTHEAGTHHFHSLIAEFMNNGAVK